MHQAGKRQSSPTRGTWIERLQYQSPESSVLVVPHAGDVDRKFADDVKAALQHKVVPHAGDVDRKLFAGGVVGIIGRSSPTRGTWIERSARLSADQRDKCRPPRGGRG